MYPRVNIDLNKLKKNVNTIKKVCSENDLRMGVVTKVFCADKTITEAILEEDIDFLADSRIENLKTLKDVSLEKWLIRIPMKSEIKDLVKYSNLSLNSELEIIELIQKESEKQNRIHKIILMIDLGDLREGIFKENELLDTAEKVVKSTNLKLEGIGVNLTCYGGVIPDEKTLGKLLHYKYKIENKLNMKLKIISGGNSSSLHLLFKDNMPEGINNLRIGEAVVLGRETAYGEKIDETFDDVFLLEAEIVEKKLKPSVPIGEIGMDAFGNKPKFKDKGDMIRGICAVGRQDIEKDGLIPVDPNIEIIGASSDHLILDLTKVESNYKLGDTVKFKLKYSSLLKIFTSKYVKKNYLNK
ncbi:MAG: ornithine racemase Orr [Eubacteriales bacterium]